MNFKFTKKERLSSKRDIDRLFEEGRNIRYGKLLFKFIVADIEDRPPCQYLVVVPKRRIKKAVHRNRIKRQIREVIRLNKSKVPVAPNKRLLLGVVYQGNEAPVYGDLESDYLGALVSLDSTINKN